MATYDFHMLSSADFEEFCGDLLGAHLSCHVEAFRTGRDGGIDLRYTKCQETTIVQCKHYVGSKFSDLIAILKKEKDKIILLNPNRYVLMTSLPLSPSNKNQIRSALEPFINEFSDIIGQDDLNMLLKRHPQVEQRNFKLWFTSVTVLSRLLAQATYLNTEFNIERIKDKITLYVANRSFDEGRSILEKHNILLISGPPGVGKTTLADMLMFSYMAMDYEPIRIFDDVDEGMGIIDRSRKQIIIFDDFLGQIQLDSISLSRRDSRIRSFVDVISKSTRTRFILTTREYILRQAQSYSEQFADPTFSLYKYLLDVGKYTRLARARILYNHLYFSKLNPEYREAIRTNRAYLKIIDHANFNPRVISWISDPQYLSGIDATAYPDYVLATLNNPARLWTIAFRKHLSRAAQTLLMTLASLRDRSSIRNVEKAFVSMHSYLSDALKNPIGTTDFSDALQETEGSFITIEERQVRFVNPSFREFVENLLLNNEIETKALVNSTSLCAQLNVLLQWLDTKPRTTILTYVSNHILDSFVRVADLMEGSGWRLDGSSVELSIILATTLEKHPTDEVVKLITRVSPGWAKSVAGAYQDAQRMPRLIRIFRGLLPTSLGGLDTLIKAAKEVALTVGMEEWSDLNLYDAYWDVLTEDPNDVDDDDLAFFNEKLRNYIESDAAYQFEELNSLEELQAYEDKLAKISDENGLSCSAVMVALESRKEELEEEAEHEPDDDWRGHSASGATEEITTDDAIGRLFDSL
jgi:hypothetical protein